MLHQQLPAGAPPGADPQQSLRLLELGCGPSLAFTLFIAQLLLRRWPGRPLDLFLIDPLLGPDVAARTEALQRCLGACSIRHRVACFDRAVALEIQSRGGVDLVYATQTFSILGKADLEAVLEAVATALAPGGLLVAVHEPGDAVTDERNRAFTPQARTVEDYARLGRQAGLDLQLGAFTLAHGADDPPEDDHVQAGFVFRKRRPGIRQRRLLP